MEFTEALNLLNVDEDDILGNWYKGLKYIEKNRYLKIGDAMLVELTQDKYMVVDNCRAIRDVLRAHCFCTGNYATTKIPLGDRQTSKLFHQLYFDYPDDQVADHISRNTFDNREQNIRFTTHKQNSRNLSKCSINTSGYQGVYLKKQGEYEAWIAQIYNNAGKRIT